MILNPLYKSIGKFRYMDQTIGAGKNFAKCAKRHDFPNFALVDFSHLAASPAPAGAQAPGQVDLGVFRPTGRVNPDGSEVWVPRDDSILAGRIEVDVREDGRVIRQKVLRPLRASEAVLAFNLSPHVEERVSPRSSTAGGGEAAFESIE